MFYQSGKTESFFYMFVHKWNTDINDSTHTRCYILYAYEFRFQSYLNLNNLEKNRVALPRCT